MVIIKINKVAIFVAVEAKRFYKNVLRLNRAAFHKMTAYHIFTINGRLPQQFFYLVFAHMIVVLQFNLL